MSAFPLASAWSDARFCKPLDAAMLSRVLQKDHVILTLEDHALQNGFGTAVVEHAVTHGLPTEHLTRLGMPDRMVSHATRNEQLSEVGLDAPGIAKRVRAAIQAFRERAVESELASRA